MKQVVQKRAERKRGRKCRKEAKKRREREKQAKKERKRKKKKKERKEKKESFFFNDTETTEIYTLCLHDALPICLKNHQVKMTTCDNTSALFLRLWF